MEKRNTRKKQKKEAKERSKRKKQKKEAIVAQGVKCRGIKMHHNLEFLLPCKILVIHCFSPLTTRTIERANVNCI